MTKQTNYECGFKINPKKRQKLNQYNRRNVKNNLKQFVKHNNPTQKIFDDYLEDNKE